MALLYRSKRFREKLENQYIFFWFLQLKTHSDVVEGAGHVGQSVATLQHLLTRLNQDDGICYYRSSYLQLGEKIS